jgi:hypothetical protein
MGVGDIQASGGRRLLKVKLAGQSALVQIAPSTQQITAHAGLVVVRELAASLGVAELLDEVTVKKRARGLWCANPVGDALPLELGEGVLGPEAFVGAQVDGDAGRDAVEALPTGDQRLAQREQLLRRRVEATSGTKSSPILTPGSAQVTSQ